ncbi:hypothetical protein [Methylacidimicrobium tartarophylax]|uniref:hypothetical protein n=1 Tax=Methylacidimicrobium tartarophylax TaxID=1041768 RepID=UPI0015B43C68|nr:hypothetical protein [Methylacidimicrobium tartarophylax]
MAVLEDVAGESEGGSKKPAEDPLDHIFLFSQQTALPKVYSNKEELWHEQRDLIFPESLPRTIGFSWVAVLTEAQSLYRN